eukprot:TRINITY_DN4282_c0_g1_i3.p1 TRINITY_DN4282_c0_g1~~TRINITY_DN4282_c0_g1_i3.p1  ORF type:complete len:119 (+),score=6.74 TRINITY_DN4282_c0_g1_i3:2-358(+)
MGVLWVVTWTKLFSSFQHARTNWRPFYHRQIKQTDGKLTTAPPSTEDQSSNCFSEADILLVELDMAQGKLLITTVSSSPEESTIPQQRWECSGLSPGRSYFPHFNMLGPTGDRFTIDR